MAGLDRPLRLRLSDIEHAKVVKLAAAQGVSVSECIRQLLTIAFDPRASAPDGTVVDEGLRIKFEAVKE